MPKSNYTSCNPLVRKFSPEYISSEEYKNLAPAHPHPRRFITVSRCLTRDCTGCYIDTISSSYVFICKDPKHEKLETKGAAA